MRFQNQWRESTCVPREEAAGAVPRKGLPYPESAGEESGEAIRQSDRYEGSHNTTYISSGARFQGRRCPREGKGEGRGEMAGLAVFVGLVRG